MLVRVGRWLRAAGHDTAVIENAMDDRDVFNKAVVEDRVLITRDRHFLQRDPERVIFLNSNGTEACIEELRSKALAMPATNGTQSRQCSLFITYLKML